MQNGAEKNFLTPQQFAHEHSSDPRPRSLQVLSKRLYVKQSLPLKGKESCDWLLMPAPAPWLSVVPRLSGNSLGKDLGR